MKAGRELDASVAKRIMGKTPCVCTKESMEKRRDEEIAKIRKETPAFYLSPTVEIWPHFGPDARCNYCGEHYLPFYSTDISCAWEVVETMLSRSLRGLYMSDNKPGTVGADGGAGRWHVYFSKDGDGGTYGHAAGETAPHAICLAALACQRKMFEEAADAVLRPINLDEIYDKHIKPKQKGGE